MPLTKWIFFHKNTLNLIVRIRIFRINGYTIIRFETKVIDEIKTQVSGQKTE